MQVAELRSLLDSIAETVSAGGGKKSANDLKRVCELLDTFGTLSISQFGDFLAKAEYYLETGKLRRPGGKKGKPAIDADRVQRVAQQTLDLYERSIDEDVDYAFITAGVDQLDGLPAREVIEVARQMGIHRRMNSKSEAISEIRQMIEQRKESYQRTAFMPSSAN